MLTKVLTFTTEGASQGRGRSRLRDDTVKMDLNDRGIVIPAGHQGQFWQLLMERAEIRNAWRDDIVC